MNKIKSVLLISTSFTMLFQGCYDCKTTLEKATKPKVIEGIIIGRDSIHNYGIPIVDIQNANGFVESFGMGALKSLW